MRPMHDSAGNEEVKDILDHILLPGANTLGLHIRCEIIAANALSAGPQELQCACVDIAHVSVLDLLIIFWSWYN